MPPGAPTWAGPSLTRPPGKLQFLLQGSLPVAFLPEPPLVPGTHRCPPPHPCLLAHFRPQRATPVGGACPQRDDRPCGGPAGCPRPLCSRPKTEMTEGNRRCEDRTDRDSVCLGAGHRLTAGLELPPGLFAGASAVPLQENSHPLCPWSLPLRPERQGTWEQSLHR